MAPERDSGGDLAIELVQRHIGLVPLVGRDHTAIGLSGSIDDREDGRALVITTGADVAHDANLSPGVASCTAGERQRRLRPEGVGAPCPGVSGSAKLSRS